MQGMLAVCREALAFAFMCAVRGVSSKGERAAACRQHDMSPDQWAEHDGLLSVHGQRAPLDEPSRPLPMPLTSVNFAAGTSLGSQLSTSDLSSASRVCAGDIHVHDCPPSMTLSSTRTEGGRLHQLAADGVATLERGVWHMHEINADHFAICGGPLAIPESRESFWGLFMQLRMVLDAQSLVMSHE